MRRMTLHHKQTHDTKSHNRISAFHVSCRDAALTTSIYPHHLEKRTKEHTREHENIVKAQTIRPVGKFTLTQVPQVDQMNPGVKPEKQANASLKLGDWRIA